MEYKINEDKLLQAVLMDEDLKKLGNYSISQIGSIYEALDSDNYIVNVVAQIIQRTGEGASQNELWKEINKYLIDNV